MALLTKKLFKNFYSLHFWFYICSYCFSFQRNSSLRGFIRRLDEHRFIFNLSNSTDTAPGNSNLCRNLFFPTLSKDQSLPYFFDIKNFWLCCIDIFNAPLHRFYLCRSDQFFNRSRSCSFLLG